MFYVILGAITVAAIYYSQIEHEQQADQLDMILRLSHPDWLPLLHEFAEIRRCQLEHERAVNMNQNLQLFTRYMTCTEKIQFFVDIETMQDFYKSGVNDPTKWWRENLAFIAGFSDNELVLEAREHYLRNE